MDDLSLYFRKSSFPLALGLLLVKVPESELMKRTIKAIKIGITIIAIIFSGVLFICPGLLVFRFFMHILSYPRPDLSFSY